MGFIITPWYISIFKVKGLYEDFSGSHAPALERAGNNLGNVRVTTRDYPYKS